MDVTPDLAISDRALAIPSDIADLGVSGTWRTRRLPGPRWPRVPPASIAAPGRGRCWPSPTRPVTSDPRRTVRTRTLTVLCPKYDIDHAASLHPPV